MCDHIRDYSRIDLSACIALVAFTTHYSPFAISTDRPFGNPSDFSREGVDALPRFGIGTLGRFIVKDAEGGRKLRRNLDKGGWR
jgi:hypothetical protein